MRQYVYKIQWLFTPKESYNIIKLLGARSLTKICLRDLDLKILDVYSGMNMYPCGYSEIKTIRYIKDEVKKNKNIVYVELFR